VVYNCYFASNIFYKLSINVINNCLFEKIIDVSNRDNILSNLLSKNEKDKIVQVAILS
jgi:hypothetical protein